MLCGQILIQRAAIRGVHELNAAADAQHRFIPLHRVHKDVGVHAIAQRDRRLALSLLTRLAAAAAALTVLLGVVLLVTQAEGQDMFPAVKDGDLLIAYRLQRRWAQDDLVRLGRVAAVGGDVVMLEEDGTLRVNGTLHAGEVLYPTYPAGGVTYPYTVPEGCLFILNDYRTHGRDSRHFGAVPQQDAAGKVITLLRRRGL